MLELYEFELESSIGKWGNQGNFKPVYFFYEKISHAQKAHKQKRANKTKISKQKTSAVFCTHNFKRVKITCLHFVLFVRVKPFRKNNKQV